MCGAGSPKKSQIYTQRNLQINNEETVKVFCSVDAQLWDIGPLCVVKWRGRVVQVQRVEPEGLLGSTRHWCFFSPFDVFLLMAHSLHFISTCFLKHLSLSLVEAGVMNCSPAADGGNSSSSSSRNTPTLIDTVCPPQMELCLEIHIPTGDDVFSLPCQQGCLVQPPPPPRPPQWVCMGVCECESRCAAVM